MLRLDSLYIPYNPQNWNFHLPEVPEGQFFPSRDITFRSCRCPKSSYGFSLTFYGILRANDKDIHLKGASTYIVKETLAAVSLAGNIVNFLDFGLKIVFKGREIYLANDGTLSEHNDLEAVTRDLLLLQTQMNSRW